MSIHYKTPRMNLDRTFCTGLRCGAKESCDRWLQNLVNWSETTGRDLADRRISVAQFADQDGVCVHYAPLEEGAG